MLDPPRLKQDFLDDTGWPRQRGHLDQVPIGIAAVLGDDVVTHDVAMAGYASWVAVPNGSILRRPQPRFRREG